jgi:hypothetical protein
MMIYILNSNPSWSFGEIVAIVEAQSWVTSEHSDHPPQISMAGLRFCGPTAEDPPSSLT